MKIKLSTRYFQRSAHGLTCTVISEPDGSELGTTAINWYREVGEPITTTLNNLGTTTADHIEISNPTFQKKPYISYNP